MEPLRLGRRRLGPPVEPAEDQATQADPAEPDTEADEVRDHRRPVEPAVP